MVLVVKGKGKKEGGKIEYVVEKDLIPLLRSVILSHILATRKSSLISEILLGGW